MTKEQFAQKSFELDLQNGLFATNHLWKDLRPIEQDQYLVEAQYYLEINVNDRPLWVKQILSRSGISLGASS